MIFVESLKRLYEQGKVSIEKLNQLVSDKKINKDEFIYISRKEE